MVPFTLSAFALQHALIFFIWQTSAGSFVSKLNAEPWAHLFSFVASCFEMFVSTFVFAIRCFFLPVLFAVFLLFFKLIPCFLGLFYLTFQLIYFSCCSLPIFPNIATIWTFFLLFFLKIRIYSICWTFVFFSSLSVLFAFIFGFSFYILVSFLKILRACVHISEMRHCSYLHYFLLSSSLLPHWRFSAGLRSGLLQVTLVAM